MILNKSNYFAQTPGQPEAAQCKSQMLLLPSIAVSLNQTLRANADALQHSNLSTCRSVEDNPYGEVFGKVLEVMLGSSSDEHNITRLECVSLAVMK